VINGIAYGVLIVIWSTTPLAIKWSADEVSFAGAIFWRILLSAIIALCIVRVKAETIWGYRNGVRFYTVAAIGIAPNFLLVYWASQWITSGLISVIFSTTPFVMGVLSYTILGKQVFTVQRVIALMVAVCGLLVVFTDQLLLVGANGVYGIMAMVLSVFSFSVSGTYLQKIEVSIPVLQKTTGGLCFSVPMLALAWWALDGTLPWPISLQSGLSIMYLAIAGSLLGFALYYFLLQRLSAYVVSTVGMISPVFALLLGHFLDGEPLTAHILIGTGLVLFGLTLYHVRSSALKSAVLKSTTLVELKAWLLGR
jgi:drug/metabolite transporter (DMT)-like permease